MSAPDEFDPFVERLYARTPTMPDAAMFAAGVEQRLDRGSRLRTVFLSLAGLVGGVVAVRETLAANFAFSAGATAESGARAVDAGVGSVAARGQLALAEGLQQAGLAQLDLGAMGGMTLFWVVAAAVIGAASLGALKLAGEV